MEKIGKLLKNVCTKLDKRISFVFESQKEKLNVKSTKTGNFEFCFLSDAWSLL